MQKKQKICVYARFGTHEQSEQHCNKQLEAVKRNYRGADVYKDFVSGLSPIMERPSVKEIIAKTERGIYDTIIVPDINRISRNPIDFLRFKQKMSARNVNVLLATEGGDI